MPVVSLKAGSQEGAQWKTTGLLAEENEEGEKLRIEEIPS